MFRKKKKAWVVAADMGYGHLRAALPFEKIAEGGKIIYANNYPGIPESDKNVWDDSRNFYEIVSRFKRFPVIGDLVFALFDKFQEIEEFHGPHEHIETPTLQLRHSYKLMRKRKWGRNLIWQLNKKPRSLLTSFFVPAHMAEFYKYQGPIYLIVTDTDVSRAWAPFNPEKSKIIYCVPTKRVKERLLLYGVPANNIIFTGFPLPKEFTKNNNARAKKDLRRRLQILDKKHRYREQYERTIEQHLGRVPQGNSKKRVVVTFAIGGAGAQAELAEDIMEEAIPLLNKGRIELHIVTGIHLNIARNLQKRVRKHIVVHEAQNKKIYFKNFSNILSKTDILWTKPSELVFYAGLGIPLIMSPPIGAQEKANRKWLLDIGAGIDQEKPENLSHWLPDLLDKGSFAEAAMQGFIEIPRDGTENITKLVCG